MRSFFSNTTFHTKLDLLGAFLSLACAVHCIVIPLLVVLLPLLGLSFFLNQTVEKVFVIASILLAAFNLCWGYTIHKKIRILLIFLAAAAMVISGIFILPHQHAHAQELPAILESSHPQGIHNHNHGQEPETLAHGNAPDRRPQDNPLGLLLLIVGGTAIAVSHLLNRHFCKSCQNCQGSHRLENFSNC